MVDFDNRYHQTTFTINPRLILVFICESGMNELAINLGLRKIQLIHGSAFINLPRAWIRTNDLNKGDRVSVGLRRDGTLEISCIVASKEGGDA